MQFIDTHSHLYDDAYSGEEDLAVQKAMTAGVEKIIVPDIDSETRSRMFSLTDRHQGLLFPTIGIHPTSVTADWKKEADRMMEFSDRKVWAIGEIGMDCYWSKEFVSEQKEVMKLMLEMAHERSLPVIIHSRDATEQIFDVLKSCRHLDLRGVFHAFGGSIETYRQIRKLGDWSVGIGGDRKSVV